LFRGLPSAEEIRSVESEIGEEKKEDVEHVEEVTTEDEKMDIDEPEVREVKVADEDVDVHGMPKWGWEEERMEVRKGVRLISMDEVGALPGQADMPSWLDS
jgi:dual specificity MAP kinase phosphatase